MIVYPTVNGLPPPQQYHPSNAPVNEYIVNGNDVDKGRWPWMLSLEVLDPEFRHTCGASLIGRETASLFSIHLKPASHSYDFRRKLASAVVIVIYSKTFKHRILSIAIVLPSLKQTLLN